MAVAGDTHLDAFTVRKAAKTHGTGQRIEGGLPKEARCVVVEDSMNERWTRRADIWFESLPEARRFGRHHAMLSGPYGPVDDLRRVAEVASGRAKAAP